MENTLWEYLLSGVIGAGSALIAGYLVITYALPRVINRYIEKTISDPDNKIIMENYLDYVCDKVQKRILGSFGGMASGISKQMGKMEEELQTDGLTQQIGNPIAASMIMKYAKKYPILGVIIPTILSNPTMLAGIIKGTQDKTINTSKTPISDELYK